MNELLNYADLSFEPSPTVPKAVADQLGLFRKLAAQPCLMEFFSCQPTHIEVRSCLAKLFTYHGELLRKARGPVRDYLLELIHKFYLELEAKPILTQPEKELVMNFSPAYLQARQRLVQEGIQQGMQQGRVEGQRGVVEHLLKSRFGKLDNSLSKVIEGVIQLPPDEVAPLLLQASRDELVTRFNGKRSRRK